MEAEPESPVLADDLDPTHLGAEADSASLVHSFFQGSEWPWDPQAREELFRTRGRMPEGMLFIDRLLELAGFEQAEELYPPETPQDLEQLLQAIEASPTFDKLKRYSLVYYLLKDCSNQRAEQFASRVIIPTHFAKGIDGLWSMDHCHFKAAIRSLSDPSVTPDFIPFLLQALSTVPPADPPSLRASLLTSFHTFLAPALSTPHLALPIVRAYSTLGQIRKSWDIQRGFPVGGERELVLSGLLESVFGGVGIVSASEDPDAGGNDIDSEDLYAVDTPALKPQPHRESISILAHMPFDTFEDSLFASFALSPPSSIASSPPLRNLVRQFYISHLINETRYVEAVRFEREVRSSSTGEGEGDEGLRKVVKMVMEVMPAVQREVIEMEERELAASAPGLASFEPAVPPPTPLGGSWSFVGGTGESKASTPRRPLALPVTAFLGGAGAEKESTPRSLMKALALQKAQRVLSEQQNAQNDDVPMPSGQAPATPAKGDASTGSAPPSASGTRPLSHSPFVAPARLPSSAQKAVPSAGMSSNTPGMPPPIPPTPASLASASASPVSGFVHAAATPSAKGMIKKRVARTGQSFGSPFGTPVDTPTATGMGGGLNEGGGGLAQRGGAGMFPMRKTSSAGGMGVGQGMKGKEKRVVSRSGSRRPVSRGPSIEPAGLVGEEEDSDEDPMLLKPSTINQPVATATNKGKRGAARHPEPPFSEDGRTVAAKRRVVPHRQVVPGGFSFDDGSVDGDGGGEGDRTVVVHPQLEEPEMRESGTSQVVGRLVRDGQRKVVEEEAEEEELQDAFPDSPPPSISRRGGNRIRRSESVSSVASSAGGVGGDGVPQTPRRSSRLSERSESMGPDGAGETPRKTPGKRGRGKKGAK